MYVTLSVECRAARYVAECTKATERVIIQAVDSDDATYVFETDACLLKEHTNVFAAEP